MSSRRKGAKTCRGFTLIELLLVLVLLGVGVGLTVVSVGTLVSRWQERSAISDVLSILKMARVSAMSSGRTVTVEVTGSGNLTVRGATRDKTLALKPPFALSLGEANASRYAFWPDGSMESGSFDLLANGRVVHHFELNGISARIQ